MQNSPLKIYLAGFIEFKNDGKELVPECMTWRKYIREYYQKFHTSNGDILDYGIQFFDPLVGESPKDKISDSLIFAKDYLSIKNCDIIISNLETFNSSRMPLGTVLETGIAYEMKKQIIVISSDPRYINHPFITRMACSVFPDVESLCKSKVLNILFKSINTALY